MAITPTCKVTYSLKPETVERVQELATHWACRNPKSSAAPSPKPPPPRRLPQTMIATLSPLEALEWLSKNGISKEEADRFNKETRRERRAWGRKRG